MSSIISLSQNSSYAWVASKIERDMPKLSLEMIAKHHTRVTTYWHGTSSDELNEILRIGLVPKSLRSNNRIKDPSSIEKGNFEPISSGIYLTTSVKQAYGYATRKIRNLHLKHKKVLIACHITNSPDIGIDEDIIMDLLNVSGIQKDIRNTILNNGDPLDSIHSYDWILKNKALSNNFMKVLEKEFENKDKHKRAFEIIFDNLEEWNLNRWLYLLALNTEELLEEPQNRKLREEYREVSKKKLRDLGVFAYGYKEDTPGSIYFANSLGYKGKNRIVAIYKEVENTEDKKIPDKEDFAVYYKAGHLSKKELDNKLEKALSNYKIRVIHKE
jgi:hypothetical protein